MDRTDNFFVISNYNTDPQQLTRWTTDYLVYDQSDDPEVVKLITDRADPKVLRVKHTGHNLIDYFTYIVDNYHKLPKTVAFVKGNIIGRHVTEDFWTRNYRNTWFTPLWDDPDFNNKPNIAYSLYSGKFIERNNSWYVPHSNCRYFNNLNQLLDFFYEIERFPEFLLFAPGACYIVEKERILKNPVSFYQGLIQILNHSFFPSEAWMVERIMSVIFDSDLRLKTFVYNNRILFEQIENLPDISNWQPREKNKSWIRSFLIYRIERVLKILKA